MAKCTVDWDRVMEQVGGDRDFLDEVLQDLMNEAKSSEAEMRTGIAEKDFLKIGKAAHKIKGSASYLYCEDLKDVSLVLQDLGYLGAQDDSDKPQILENIKQQFEIWKVRFEELRNELADKK